MTPQAIYFYVYLPNSYQFSSSLSEDLYRKENIEFNLERDAKDKSPRIKS